MVMNKKQDPIGHALSELKKRNPTSVLVDGKDGIAGREYRIDRKSICWNCF